jgi:ribonuclease III
MVSQEALSSTGDLTNLAEAEAVLGYGFKNTEHLLNALTRRSYWHENRETCLEHNERLEFLGDAVLGLVIAGTLYRRFPGAEEGELQKKRASIVNRGALADVMRKLDLARFLRMGKGDELSGCRERDSILADTLEAIIAAVFLDGGYESAEQFIDRHFLSLVDRCALGRGVDDCKSLLQEKAQATYGVTPSYRVMAEWGEEHRKTFSVAVFLGDHEAGVGVGKNKREAAQNAAQRALIAMEEDQADMTESSDQ